jgi:hypothetical protein
MAQSVMPLVPGSAGRGGGVPPAPGWLAGLGVLTCDISPGLVGEVIDLAGRREERRRLLPASAVAYFVLGLCLFSGADSSGPPGYRSVMRSQTNGLRDEYGVALPSGAALARARERLGSKPFELLFDRCRGPLAGAGSPGAFASGRRLVAWDGTDLDAADTPANRAGFGCHRGGGGPKLRLVALTECGTRAVIDAAFDSSARVHELTLARQLLASLRPGMLLLADRQFPGWELWGLAAATGADLLWRARNNLVFTRVRELPDGSYLAVMPTPAENKRLGAARHRGRAPDRIPDGHLIRVIEYRVDVTSSDGTRTSEQFRLVTTLLDSGEAPAAALAALYRERWESETGYGELKTRLRGARLTLRSRTPDLTCQELLAFLTVYQALCALETQAARQAGIDPDRISFTVTLRVARDSAASPASILTPASLARARQHAIADILAAQLPARRDRHYERAASHAKDSTYPGRKPGQPRPPSQVTYTITITPKPTPPQTA